METEILENNTTVKKRSKKKIVFLCVVVFIAVLFIALMIGTHVLMKQNFPRGEYAEYSMTYRYDRYEDDYPRTPVSFKSGENTLKGYVYGGNNDKGLIVVAHGIGGGHEGYINEIVWFVDRGWRVFAYDATGSCESEGDGTMGLPQSALDLDCALKYIESDSELKNMKKFLYGHSWGGYAVTAVLNFDHDIAASASIAGYAEPMEMIMEFADGMMGKASNLFYPFIWIDNKALFGEYSSLSAVDGINNTDTPVLVIHGKDDQMIGYDRSSIISKKDSITNPNVEYYTIGGDYCGHNTIFYFEEANEYRVEMDEEFEKLGKNYEDGEVPDDVKKEFVSKADKEKANGVNTQMLEKINSFYENAL